MPATIIKCERVSHPPVRFIGKKFPGYPNWGEAWEHGWFDAIEQAGAPAAINDSSYCVLTGFAPGGIECYLGQFFPSGTPVPDGFDHAYLPEMTAALFFIKGQQGECYEHVFGEKRSELLAEMERCGMAPPPSEPPPRWASFERDNCPRWTDPDADGNVILDYAIYL
jgi:hypothetical protein